MALGSSKQQQQKCSFKVTGGLLVTELRKSSCQWRLKNSSQPIFPSAHAFPDLGGENYTEGKDTASAVPKLCLPLLSEGPPASEQSQSAACSCHLLSSELYLLHTYWQDANNQLHSLHSSDSALTYDLSACSDFFLNSFFSNALKLLSDKSWFIRSRFLFSSGCPFYNS